MRAPPALLPRVVAVASLASMLTACGGSQDASVPDPLSALPGCEAVRPTSGPVDLDAGLLALLPADTIVTSVESSGPSWSVEGWVAATPVDVRRAYEHRGDVEVLSVEDEVIEAEVLVGDGEHRAYVVVVAACPEESRVVAVIGPEV